MKKLMSISILGLLALLAAQGPARAQDERRPDAQDLDVRPLQRAPHEAPGRAPGDIDAINQPKSVREVDMALGQLDDETTAQKKALDAEYEERRRELVGSQDYKALSRRERKSKLRALKDEYKEREQKLDESYRSRREEFNHQKENIPEERIESESRP